MNDTPAVTSVEAENLNNVSQQTEGSNLQSQALQLLSNPQGFGDVRTAMQGTASADAHLPDLSSLVNSWRDPEALAGLPASARAELPQNPAGEFGVSRVSGQDTETVGGNSFDTTCVFEIPKTIKNLNC